jgi:hypothetical protein
MNRVKAPFLPYFCSFKDKIKTLLYDANCTKWGARFLTSDIYECGRFPVEDIIYL